MQIAFAAADNDIIVTTVGFEAGNMTTAVQRFNTTIADEEEGRIWRTALPENALPFAVAVRGSSVFVLCDTAVYALDLSSGELVGAYNYRGTLLDFAFADNNAAILVNDFTAGKVNLISFERDLKLNGIIGVSAGAAQVEIHGGIIHVLAPGAVVTSDGESFPLNEDFSRFIHMGNEILLLGYNTVEKIGDSAGISESLSENLEGE
jgi:hypothetical protein